MNRLKYISLIFCALLGLASATAQAADGKLTGIVVDSYTNQPLKGAVISVTGLESSIMTDELGNFTVEGISLDGQISVWYPGYYTNVLPIVNRTDIRVIMIPEDKYGYADVMTLPFIGTTNIRDKQTNLTAKQKNNFNLNMTDVDQAFVNIPGLQLIGKGGLPGEGSYFQIRETNSFTASSSPLLVINGVPYMPDMNESGIIGGYSKNVFNMLNAQDIENITVLKGAGAALYGSLGSNGVIMIETDKAVNLDTKVEFIGQYGMDWNSSTLPVLGVDEYKSYIGNVALTKYEDMADVLYLFPYLVDDPNYYYNYKYNNNTDWQDEIYTKAFTTDNLLKIKGGDAIAKYDFSLGYRNRGGVVKDTEYSKYFARLNADVNLSKRVTLFTTISFSYSDSKLAEQGILAETNPMLAALKKGPLFSPYEKDAANNRLPEYASIRNADGSLIENNSVSNPLSIVKNVEMKEHAYDVLLNAGLQYKITDNFSLKGLVGLYYNLKQEDVFVPGKSKITIMPLEDGLAENTVRSAHSTTLNMYFNLNANYVKTFADVHTLRTALGVQTIMNDISYNAGNGMNTANDFYKTLNNVSDNGRNYFGYNDKWNWLNYNATLQYNYNHLLGLGASLAMDASSATGENAARYQVYPAFNAVWYAKNSILKNTDFINKLNVRAEYSLSGNSRFSSSLSKYYYMNKVFRSMSGLVRANIPNKELTPERSNTFNVGLDLSVFNNRLDLTLDYYSTQNKDLIMPVSISSAYGKDYYYENVGETKSSGVEIGAQLALIQNKTMKWYVGGTLSTSTSEVKSLGKENKMVLTMGDGSAVVSEVGESLYSFYGYETKGVFAKESDVIAAGKGGQSALRNDIGIPFAAGDVHFVDQNNDGVINDDDKVSLGKATPDFFGTFYTTFQYKAFELSATFAYSEGNKMYNAVRRDMESLKDFSNQLSSASKRWMSDGQVTTVPRAVYGDPMNNSRFSDRWVEDASYLRMKELMVSYKFNLFAGTTVFVAAENLFTSTDYLGLDPETMYSYDSSLRGFDYGKIAHPRSVKVGFKLQF